MIHPQHTREELAMALQAASTVPMEQSFKTGVLQT